MIVEHRFRRVVDHAQGEIFSLGIHHIIKHLGTLIRNQDAFGQLVLHHYGRITGINVAIPVSCVSLEALVVVVRKVLGLLYRGPHVQLVEEVDSVIHGIELLLIGSLSRILR